MKGYKSETKQKGKKVTKTISLKQGDSLNILPETKEFLLGCCKCDIVHKIKVKRKKNNVILQFFEHKPKVNRRKEVSGNSSQP